MPDRASPTQPASTHTAQPPQPTTCDQVPATQTATSHHHQTTNRQPWLNCTDFKPIRRYRCAAGQLQLSQKTRVEHWGEGESGTGGVRKSAPQKTRPPFLWRSEQDS